jgi:mannose-1-phosphate guanylyltransferase/phosphomannomutase
MPKGMMLAAGRGTRLKPLTDNVPKPLLPAANRPTMCYGLNALRSIGITTICSNISYRADDIKKIIGNGCSNGVNINWLVEEEPSGTAGGFKKMESLLCDDTVVIIAGDAMLDIDLNDLLNYHDMKKSFATIGTLPVNDPSQYGVVITDDKGRIKNFQEKPSPGTEISKQANTGIYIFNKSVFDMIPANHFYDFAMHLFPAILQNNLPFYAIPLSGYWTDIGKPSDYLQANMDFLNGKINITGNGILVDGNLIGSNTDISNLIIEESVIGANVQIAEGTKIIKSVVWDNTIISEPINISDAVVTPYGIYQISNSTVTV